MRNRPPRRNRRQLGWFAKAQPLGVVVWYRQHWTAPSWAAAVLSTRGAPLKPQTSQAFRPR